MTLLLSICRSVRLTRECSFLTVIRVVWMLCDQTPIYRLVYTHLPRLLRGCLYAGYALLAFSLFVALGGSRGARARPSLGAGMAAPGGGSRYGG
jgi:hypothetical protein